MMHEQIQEASGKTLDAFGEMLNMKRVPRETDQSYRNRMVSVTKMEVPPDPILRKPWRYVFVWLVTLPWDILVYLAVLAFWALWGQKLHWETGLWCELKPNSWPMRTWYARYWGTTFGHGGFYAPTKSGGEGLDTHVEVHEHVHVEQYEVSMFIGFVLGLSLFGIFNYLKMNLLTSSFIALGVWMSGFMLFIASGWIVAALRGEHAYRGSQHEEAAYALVEQYEREKGGLS